jgi:hypothetical protein
MRKLTLPYRRIISVKFGVIVLSATLSVGLLSGVALASSSSKSHTPPTSFTLIPVGSIARNVVTNTWEPSNGYYPNNGPDTAATDGKGNSYGVAVTDSSGTTTTYYNRDFFNLCSPGAATIALYLLLNSPANRLDRFSTDVTDPAFDTYISTKTGTLEQHITHWNGSPWPLNSSGSYLRGYMLKLAWQIQIPNRATGTAGMMDVQHYPSVGVTNWVLQDALNWELSHENSKTWQKDPPYTVKWWSDYLDSDGVGTTKGKAVFHSDVVRDVAGRRHAPVLAEVNAAMLPNWNEPGKSVYHIVTIVGYDDTTNQYTYLDTCGKSTNCNANAESTDGGIHTVDQDTMWSAITNIPVNNSTAYNAGDGGWIALSSAD